MNGREIASLVLSGFVLSVSAVLTAWQILEKRRRPAESGHPEDSAYFARQDQRRTLGTLTLTLIGLATGYGAWVEPIVGGRGNPKFVQLWVGILGLLGVLVCIAGVDLLATRVYAKRLKRRLAKEGMAYIEEELGRSREEDDGPTGSLGLNGYRGHSPFN